MRYTVPQYIDPENMDETVVRFRVAQPCRDAALCAYSGGTPCSASPSASSLPVRWSSSLRRAEPPAGCETITFTVEEVAK